MPLGASFAGILLSLLLKSKKLFWTSLVILYFFSLGIIADVLISYVEKPYKIIPSYKIKNANSIVVLSGMRILNKNSQDEVEWTDPDRFFAGLRLYKEGKAKRVIFTDGFSPFLGKDITEGKLNKKDAISMGIPSNAIIVTDRANNTLQESEVLRKIFIKKNFLSDEIILVTSAFHMKRAKKLFERAGFIVQEFPVDFLPKCSNKKLIHTIYCFIPKAESLNYSSIVLREIMGRLIYKIN